MDVASILSMMESMGVTKEMRDRFSSNPSSLLQEAMGRTGLFAGMPGLNVTTSGLVDSKAKYERERNLPPKKVAPMTKESLSFLFKDNKSNKNVLLTARQTVIGTLPHHSSKSLAELSEINISGMYVRNTHKGTFLPCRIISKTSPFLGADFAVEDSNQDIAHVSVYRYPFTLDTTSDETNCIFSLGAHIAIREPTYKLASFGSGNPMIRVDSPTDIVFLDDLPPGTESETQKSSYHLSGTQAPPLRARAKSVEEWKATGTQAFKDGKWLQAAIAFSEGLKLDPHHQTLTLNRVEAYLRIGWLHSALAEARRSLDFEGLSSELRAKAIGRAARACYGMGKYDEATAFTAMLPENADLSKIARDCGDRIRERTTGKYDWVKLVRLSRKKPFRPDIADYTGAVEVRPSQTLTGHRGLFVTRNVHVGELLLVSRPIASSLAEDNPSNQKIHAFDLLTDRVTDYCGYSVICRSVTRLWDDPELAQVFQSLYAGPNLPFENSAINSHPITPRPLTHPRCPTVDVDIARVESVCSYNAFSLQSLEEILGAVNTDDIKRSEALYDLPSYCNHSCLASADRAFFGDAMVIRACRDMEAGEEVTMRYFGDRAILSKAEGDKSIEETKWGFKCKCESCAAEAADGAEVLARRARLVSSLKANPTKAKAKSLLLLIENTYKATHWVNVPVKNELAVAYRTMGLAIYSEVHAKDASEVRASIEYLIKFMDADGVLVRVPKISGNQDRKRKSDIKIDVKGPPSHGFHPIVRTLMKIAYLLRSLGDNQDMLWFKAAVMLSDIHFGGGKECFAEIYRSDLEMMDCMQFLEVV